MTSEEMLVEMDRLNAVVGKSLGGQDAEKRRAFTAELERKFLWLTPIQWREVMTHVIDNHKTRALPTIEEFSRAVRTLRAAGAVAPPTSCRSCGGSRMVYGRYRIIATQAIIDACKPCPMCRGVSPNIKPELEAVEDEDRHQVRMAKAMTPRQAMYAIEEGARVKLKWDPDVLSILLDKATGVELVEQGPKLIGAEIDQEIVNGFVFQKIPRDAHA
jgi:hypothetical protein